MLGFGTGIGGLGVGLLGQVVEHYGPSGVIHLIVFIPLFAGLFSLMLNNNSEMQRREI